MSVETVARPRKSKLSTPKISPLSGQQEIPFAAKFKTCAIVRAHEDWIAAKAAADEQLAFASRNVTVTQAIILLAIASCEQEGRIPSQVDLTEMSKVDRSTMATVVRKLCGRGYVRRLVLDAGDQRRKPVRLTDKGSHLVAAIAASLS